MKKEGSRNRIAERKRKDLKKSGLNTKQFKIIPLDSEEQLSRLLGYTEHKGQNIFKIGGYFITYPNTDEYVRLKLREPISGSKYLAPLGVSNQIYLLTQVHELTRSYKPDSPIFFTEGEKKAAKATLEGFPTIGFPGVWAFSHKKKLIRAIREMNLKHRKCYIVFDSDIRSNLKIRHAELRLVVELLNKGAKPVCVRLPSHGEQKIGFDDFLVNSGKNKFLELLAEFEDKDFDQAFILHLKEQIPLDLIQKEISRIKDKSNREKIIYLIHRNHHIPIKTLRENINYQIMQRIKPDQKVASEAFSGDEIRQAKLNLKSPDLLKNISRFISRTGYVGEHRSKDLAYLACTSRLIPGGGKSIPLIVQGDSASGKSDLIKRVLKLMPKEDCWEYSYITEKALYHINKNLAHKILVIFEREGGRNADYTLRTALSEEKISIMLPIQNQLTGDFETIEKEVNAEGLVYIETTTDDTIDAQNANRAFELFTDSSEKQTKRVLKSQAKSYRRHTKELGREERVWRCMQTLLKSISVDVPYADQLADQFPAVEVRARRDHKRLLALIETSALLHQAQREKKIIMGEKKIIATKVDFEIAYSTIEPILKQTYKKLKPKEEKLLTIIREEFGIGHFGHHEGTIVPHYESQGANVFSVVKLKRRIDRRLKNNNNDDANEFTADSTLKLYIRRLVKKNFLEWNGKKGVNSEYVLVSDTDNISFDINIEP